MTLQEQIRQRELCRLIQEALRGPITWTWRARAQAILVQIDGEEFWQAGSDKAEGPSNRGVPVSTSVRDDPPVQFRDYEPEQAYGTAEDFRKHQQHGGTRDDY